jgi:single-strand DNA-binding protein
MFVTTIVGNVGRVEPLRFTKAGVPVLNFSVCANETYIDSQGEKHKIENWVRGALWGNRAEGVAKFLKKGMPVEMSGRITAHPYLQNGEAKASLEMFVRDFEPVATGQGRAAQDGAANPDEADLVGEPALTAGDIPW